MTFIISPQWFSTHGVNDRDFAARTTPNQINQLFQQKICLQKKEIRQTLITL